MITVARIIGVVLIVFCLYGIGCDVRRWVEHLRWRRDERRMAPLLRRIREQADGLRPELDAMDALALQLERIRNLPEIEPWNRWAA